jgi:probable rRNA maturation factor
MMEIEVADQQTATHVDAARLQRVAAAIVRDHGPPACRISIALVDDATIHRLNRQYLSHDYATDVLSFVLDQTADLLEGEIVVSGETAVSQAGHYQWSPADELLLYVIHGVLHLVGFDDHTPAARDAMRCAEDIYLKQCGVSRADALTQGPTSGDT